MVDDVKEPILTIVDKLRKSKKKQPPKVQPKKVFNRLYSLLECKNVYLEEVFVDGWDTEDIMKSL